MKEKWFFYFSQINSIFITQTGFGSTWDRRGLMSCLEKKMFCFVLFSLKKIPFIHHLQFDSILFLSNLNFQFECCLTLLFCENKSFFSMRDALNEQSVKCIGRNPLFPTRHLYFSNWCFVQQNKQLEFSQTTHITK